MHVNFGFAPAKPFSEFHKLFDVPLNLIIVKSRLKLVVCSLVCAIEADCQHIKILLLNQFCHDVFVVDCHVCVDCGEGFLVKLFNVT